MKTGRPLSIGAAFIAMAALLPAIGLILAGCVSFQFIEVSRLPNRTVYGQGQEFDRTGMEVSGVTKKGEVKPVSNSRIQIRGYDKSRPGIQTVTITYRDTQAAIEVEVVPVESISIEKAPSLVKQHEGITGLTALANYGGRVPAAGVGAEALTLSGYNKDAAGSQTVTAAYYGKTAVFSVTVVEMSRLVINAPPDKASYLTGEELNLGGIKATGTWEGLGDEPVTPRYVSGFNSAVKGRQTVVVEANGRQASFAVTVRETVDPITWTPATGGFARNNTGIAYGNGIFVAVGHNDDKPSEGIVAYSPDGIAWTKREAPYANFTITTVFFAGGKFFFAGSNYRSSSGVIEGKPVIRAASKGVKEDPNQYAYFSDFAEGSSRCTGIAYGDGAWVAVFDRGKAAYSMDGREWNDIALSMDDAWDGNTGVFFDGANFIALDASGTYRISRSAGRVFIGNAQHWKRGGGALINGRPISGVVFGGDKWIGIGDDNTVGWSADGTTWTAADNVGNKDDRLRGGGLTGAAYGAGRFVAVNSRGNIIYSRDGYNWTRVFSSTFGSTAIRAVAYGDGKFVAVGDNGRIAYSRVVE